jgi:hypothetical protein
MPGQNSLILEAGNNILPHITVNPLTLEKMMLKGIIRLLLQYPPDKISTGVLISKETLERMALILSFSHPIILREIIAATPQEYSLLMKRFVFKIEEMIINLLSIFKPNGFAPKYVGRNEFWLAILFERQGGDAQCNL